MAAVDLEPTEASRRGSVLVLDDDENLRFNLSSFLQNQGFETVCVGSADEAVDAVRHRSFDVALVDYLLGTQSGIDAIRRLQENAHTPVVLMSAYLDEWVQTLAEGFRAVRCLRKPFAGQVMVDAIEDLLRHEA